MDIRRPHSVETGNLSRTSSGLSPTSRSAGVSSHLPAGLLTTPSGIDTKYLDPRHYPLALTYHGLRHCNKEQHHSARKTPRNETGRLPDEDRCFHSKVRRLVSLVDLPESLLIVFHSPSRKFSMNSQMFTWIDEAEQDLVVCFPSLIQCMQDSDIL